MSQVDLALLISLTTVGGILLFLVASLVFYLTQRSSPENQEPGKRPRVLTSVPVVSIKNQYAKQSPTYDDVENDMTTDPKVLQSSSKPQSYTTDDNHIYQDIAEVRPEYNDKGENVYAATI